MVDGQHIHGTAIAINGSGIIIMGKEGTGKSDLALRLIDRGAALIADDAVNVSFEGRRATLSCMPNIEGKMEIRNLGIVEFETVSSAPFVLCVIVDGDPARFPDPDLMYEIEDIQVPKIYLNPFEASAAIKVELALDRLNGHSTTNG